MSIPAVEPSIGGDPGAPPVSRPPGSKASRLTGAISDWQGTGIVIPLNVIDDNHVDWRMQTLDGWDSADPQSDTSEARAGADGAWDPDQYYAARIVTIGGVLRAPTYEAREVAEEQLRQAIPLRGRLVQVRIDETVPKFVTGRRSGRVMVTPLTDVMSKWQVAVFARDPRKYGTALRTGQLALPVPGGGLAPPWTPPIMIPARQGSESAVVVNSGGYESPPTIRLSGPGTDLGIANLTTGQALQFAGEVATGHSLTVDVDAGTALLDGTADRSPLPGSALVAEFMLAPGENRLQMIGTRTDVVMSATAEITWRDAWI